MLIEIHMIQNHSPANLNRDDLGAPKTCIFGGVTRARISSQAQKRSIRNPGNADDVHNRGPGFFFEAMKEYLGCRTKFFPDLVGQALDSSSIPKEERQQIIDACTKIAKSEENRPEASAKEPELDDRPKLPQLVFLERSEAQEFVRKLAEMREAKEWKGSYSEWIKGKLEKKALAKFSYELSRAYKRRSVDIALFGRMTTSDAFEDVEAAMQVAHAISTHAIVNEVDYFTAVDDLGKTGGGAGHVDEAMFNSACFYKYFCLDWSQLVHNLAGPKPDEKTDPDGHERWKREVKPEAEQLAACTLGHFISAAARTTPSGKQNSYASHCEPCGILVEIKETKIPTSHANAFAEPARRIGDPPDDAADCVSLIGRSIAQLGDHIYNVRKAYGINSTLFWHALPFYRYPLQGWKREEDGRRQRENGKELPPVPFTEWDDSNGKASTNTERKHRSFEHLGGVDGKPEGLVEAVVKAVGFEWSEIKDIGKVSAKEA
jgi:CRISPR system Cascade subunit CasC